MTRRPKNVAASVHARLLDRAKAEQRPFNELLQYYAMERFLYRLSRTGHAERFVLKGALMLQMWDAPLRRTTKDIDLLAPADLAPDDVVVVVRNCCEVDVEDDGLSFDPDSVTAEEIRLAANYDGVRARFGGRLGNARVTIQVDVGFGDVVTPEALDVEYPTLLDFEAPRLRGYTPETVIAQKLEAMVTLDMANTRMKDFMDIWSLAQSQSFEGPTLGEAIQATFRRRGTALPPELPVAFTADFHSSRAKQGQWRGYIRKSGVRGVSVPSLPETMAELRAFVMPVLEALRANQRFPSHWKPGGPWVQTSA